MNILTMRLRQPVRVCPVAVEPGALAAVAPFAERHGGRVWLITDSTIAGLYGRSLHRALADRKIDAAMLDVPPGEQSKTARMADLLHDRLLAGGIERTDLIVALGGGVVGDLAGYAAATVLRGVDWVQVPTTLLAQVDSSVGGKVGVDHARGKNLIGAFHHPVAVFVDPLVLRTLPVREVRAGFAEMVKIAAALHAPLFCDLEREAARSGSASARRLAHLIRRCIGLKAAVVERDERDRGMRAVLNLGHTVGHAVERAAGYTIRHGEAVALGMAVEARLAEMLGMLPQRDRRRLEGVLTRLHLPVRLPRSLTPDAVLRRLGADKKTVDGEARFVLLSRIGTSVTGVRVSRAQVAAALGRRT